MERNFKGVWIPKHIWLNKELTVMEKLFLVEIDSLDNEKGCFASNGHFSEFFGVSKGRCTQILKSLEKKKYIKITVIRDGKVITKRVIRILNTLFRKLNTPSEKTKYPYLENDEGNNTNTNNTLLKNTSLKEENFLREIKKENPLVFEDILKSSTWHERLQISLKAEGLKLDFQKEILPVIIHWLKNKWTSNALDKPLTQLRSEASSYTLKVLQNGGLKTGKQKQEEQKPAYLRKIS